MFTHFAEHFNEVNGKTWGIIGLGTIGRRVADIAKAFGARVIYYSASGSPAQEGYEQVDFETLLTTSDIVSVHAPLNEYTKDLMDREAFAKMKKTAIFLNLGRGPIVVEQDLYEALETGEIAAAGKTAAAQLRAAQIAAQTSKGGTSNGSGTSTGTKKTTKKNNNKNLTIVATNLIERKYRNGIPVERVKYEYRNANTNKIVKKEWGGWVKSDPSTWY